MYHVMIVDDEPIVRLGVKASIPWENGQYTLIGEYANGLAALEAMERAEAERVDILITDIKMPVMDGLQLIREALVRLPSLKVILLSSYNEFEYARQGLKLGVVDYMLKHTLEPAELAAVLARCVQAIERDKERLTGLDELQGAERERKRRKLETEVKRRLFGGAGEEGAPLGLPPEYADGYAAALLAIDGLEEMEQEHGDLYLHLLQDEMKEAFTAQVSGSICFSSGEAELFALLPGSAAAAESALLAAKALLQERLGISLTAVLVAAAGRDAAAPGPALFWQARRVLERRFFGGGGQLYRAGESQADGGGDAADAAGLAECEPIAGAGHSRAGGGAVASGDANGPGGAAEPGGCRTGNHAGGTGIAPGLDGHGGATVAHLGDLANALLLHQLPLEQALAGLEQRWRAGKRSPDAISQEAGELLSHLWVNHPESPNLIDLVAGIRRMETLQQLIAYLAGSIRVLVKNRSSIRPLTTGSEFIHKALAYIGEHYTEELTLQSVSDQVHISKNYFCLMFKKETGQNFIDYVISLRITRAKQLLLSTPLKIYEVAQEAGFHDVKYFSKLFKKLTDCSPVDYRVMHKDRPVPHPLP